MTDRPTACHVTHERDGDGWFTPGRFAWLLLGLIVITFPKVIFGGENFFFRDFGAFGYPLAHYQRECFWRGELALWNPLNSFGLPFLAQWNTLTLYPLSLIYLLFPLSWSLGIFNLAHLFLAGLGMYFLVRQWTNNRFAATVAGAVFAFNGLTWHSLMWPNDIAALGWMPWVVWTVERAWRDGNRRMVWAALAGAMQMLSGAPEVILLTWGFLGVLCFTQIIRADVPRLPRLLRFGGVVALVAGLAAAQLLPFLQLISHSQRSATYGNSAGWAMPLSGLANFIAPLFHCFQTSQGIFMQREQYWIASYYTGVGTLLLALTMFWRPKKRRIKLLIALAIFSVWLALGDAGYFYSFSHRVLPALGFMRYPIKFVVLAVFILPILAAYGIKRGSLEAAGDRGQTKSLATIATALLLCLGLITWLAWKFPLPGDDVSATQHNILWRGFFVIAAAAVLLSLWRVQNLRSGIILRVVFVLLLWADIATHAVNLSPTVTRTIYAENLIRPELKLSDHYQPGEPRALSSGLAREKFHLTSVTNAVNDYLGRRLALFDNINLLDDIGKVDGFYSLDLQPVSEVIALLYGADAKGIDLRGLKDFIGIARINPPGSNQQNALEWIERTNYLPLITAGQQPLFAAANDSLGLLANPDFAPQETVALPLEAKDAVHAQRTDARLSEIKIQTQRMQFQIHSVAPAMVVIAQAFYQPWHAYVDGHRVKLWMANHAFEALEVPAGEHSIVLVYQDRALQTGLFIGCISLLILLIIWRTTKPA